MSQSTFTFRVDEVLKDDFATIVKSMDRIGTQLLRDYMRDIVRRQKAVQDCDIWFREQVQIGLDSANTGNLVSSEEVETKFVARRAATRRKLDGFS